MKRALASALVLASVALTLSAGRASAQETPAAVQVVPAPVAAPAGVVRLHFRTYRDRQHAQVYAQRRDDSWAVVCDVPCTIDSPVGAELRMTIGGHDDEPHSFTVPGDVGPEMDVEIKPASVGPLVGGIVMMGTGGAVAILGLLCIAVASSASSVRGADDLQTIGIVITGVGAVSVGGGLLWLSTRSHEPRTTEKQHRPGSRVYGRNETLLGDVASARPRDPANAIAAPATPLRLGFTF